MSLGTRFGTVHLGIKTLVAVGLLLSPSLGCSSGDRGPVTPTNEAARSTAKPSPPRCNDPSKCTTRQLADAAGVMFGAAVASSHLDEGDYRTTLTATFNSVTPENELKWATIHPMPDTWNFGPADEIVNFAREHRLQVKGHNLIWDQEAIDSTPDWVLAIDDPAKLRTAVTDHIRTVIRRYRGEVDRWDVVNEPLQTLTAAPYDNHFRRVLGDDYIAEIFAIAHTANPAARLFLNESTVEFLPDKAAALVALVAGLRDQGVPIDGVGIQTHLVTGTMDSVAMRRLIGDLEGLGVEVAITELDVPTIAVADPAATQADTYRQVLDACLDAHCREVTLWGFTDRYTWIDKAFGLGRAPLPFDRDYRPKPALEAMRERIAELLTPS